MAQKTLVGGTTYEIAGGRSMADGTAYEIPGGRTLVDGTAYEIVLLSLPPITVNITGTGNSSYCYVTINDTIYYTETTLEIKAGTTIKARASAGNSGQREDCFISMNGTKVLESAGTYTFTPDCETVNIVLSGSLPVAKSNIKITTA